MRCAPRCKAQHGFPVRSRRRARGRPGPGRRGSNATAAATSAWSCSPAAVEKAPLARNAKCRLLGPSMTPDQTDDAVDRAGLGVELPGERVADEAIRERPALRRRPRGRCRPPRTRRWLVSSMSAEQRRARRRGRRARDPSRRAGRGRRSGPRGRVISLLDDLRARGGRRRRRAVRIVREVAHELFGRVVVAAREHLPDDVGEGGRVDVRDLARVRGRARRAGRRPRS